MSREPESELALQATALETGAPSDRGERPAGSAGRRLVTLTASGSAGGPRARLATHSSLSPGDHIGRFEILECVGRGGMGEVFAARDPDLERTVALKLLRTEEGRGSAPRAQRERLLREARAMARLEHANVMTVYEVGQVVDRDYIAMAFVDGESVEQWLKRTDRPAPERVLAVFLDAAKGLQAAHRAGLIHRDFKPSNVMLGKDGRVLVTDFGLARLDADVEADAPAEVGDGHTGDMSLTRTGTLLGTPLYMAPEQHRGEATDARTDQYSFCASLYEGLYGVPPFPGVSLEDVHRAKRELAFCEPLAGTVADRARHQAILRGLAVDPDERFPSMDELIGALEPPPRRQRKPWLELLGLVVVLVAVVIVLYLRADRSARAPETAAATSEVPTAVLDPTLAARVDAVRAEAATVAMGARGEWASQRLEELYASARDIGHPPLVAELLLTRAEQAADRERVAEAQRLLEEAMSAIEVMEDDRLRTRAEVTAAEFALSFEVLDKGRAQATRRAIALFERYGGSPRTEARVQRLRAMNLMDADAPDDAESLILAAIEGFEREGDRFHAANTMLELAFAIAKRRGPEPALPLAERSCSLIAGLQGRPHVVTVEYCGILAEMLSLTGRSEQALALVMEDAAWWADATQRQRYFDSLPAALEPGERVLTGRVLDRQGRPVAGARVAAGLKLPGGSRYRTEKLTAFRVLLGQGALTVTDEEGRFSMPALRAETPWVVAEATGRGRSRTVRLEADRESIDLVLEPVGHLRGTVGGLARPGESDVMELNFTREGGSGSSHSIAVSADREFAMQNLLPGHYRVFLTALSSRELLLVEPGTVTVVAGEETALSLTVRRSEQGRDIAVTVRSRHGMSVSAVQVVILPSGVAPEDVTAMQQATNDHAGAVWISSVTAADRRSRSIEVAMSGVEPGPHSVCVLILPDNFKDPAILRSLRVGAFDVSIVCQPAEWGADGPAPAVLFEI